MNTSNSGIENEHLHIYKYFTDYKIGLLNLLILRYGNCFKKYGNNYEVANLDLIGKLTKIVHKDVLIIFITNDMLEFINNEVEYWKQSGTTDKIEKLRVIGMCQYVIKKYTSFIPIITQFLNTLQKSSNEKNGLVKPDHFDDFIEYIINKLDILNYKTNDRAQAYNIYKKWTDMNEIENAISERIFYKTMLAFYKKCCKHSGRRKEGQEYYDFTLLRGACRAESLDDRALINNISASAANNSMSSKHISDNSQTMYSSCSSIIDNTEIQEETILENQLLPYAMSHCNKASTAIPIMSPSEAMVQSAKDTMCASHSLDDTTMNLKDQRVEYVSIFNSSIDCNISESGKKSDTEINTDCDSFIVTSTQSDKSSEKHIPLNTNMTIKEIHSNYAPNLYNNTIHLSFGNLLKRKETIPSTLKRLVWNKYVGEEIGKSKCLCCKTTDITQLSFHCGHVISEADGGTTDIHNLRPICQNCNSSMRTMNMNEFIETYKLHE